MDKRALNRPVALRVIRSVEKRTYQQEEQNGNQTNYE
jgi:hypothetical protein